MAHFQPGSVGKVVMEVCCGKRGFLMDKKYGNLANGWCSKVVTRPNGVSLWKHISRGWVMALRPSFGMTFGVGIVL